MHGDGSGYPVATARVCMAMAVHILKPSHAGYALASHAGYALPSPCTAIAMLDCIPKAMQGMHCHHMQGMHCHHMQGMFRHRNALLVVINTPNPNPKLPQAPDLVRVQLPLQDCDPPQEVTASGWVCYEERFQHAHRGSRFECPVGGFPLVPGLCVHFHRGGNTGRQCGAQTVSHVTSVLGTLIPRRRALPIDTLIAS